MTATDELRRMLDERGVEWEALSDQQDGDLTITATRWHDGEGGLLTMFISEPHGSTLDFFWLPTPEQAIAATLGADASPTQAESSVTLTAEKVRELMEENSRQYPSPTDPYVWLTEYDWQAIADELNATLGSFNYTNGERTDRTCHMEYCDEWSGDELYPTEAYVCSACGYITEDGKPNYCPNCGRRVEVDE